MHFGNILLLGYDTFKGQYPKLFFKSDSLFSFFTIRKLITSNFRGIFICTHLIEKRTIKKLIYEDYFSTYYYLPVCIHS